MELINETMFQHAHVKASLKAGNRLPAGRKRAAYSKMFMGLVYLGAFVLLGPKYNFSVALKDDFMKMSLLKRYVTIYYAILNLKMECLLFFHYLELPFSNSVDPSNEPNITPSGP